jgi:hypothetical protein
MTADLFRKILATVIIARAGYAILLFLAIMLFRFDIANPANIAGDFAQLVTTLPLMLIPLWAAYVAGYFTGGVLVWRSSQKALWVYGAAFVGDISLWAFVYMHPNYAASYAGTAEAIDTFFNALDASILVGMAWLIYRRVLR